MTRNVPAVRLRGTQSGTPSSNVPNSLQCGIGRKEAPRTVRHAAQIVFDSVLWQIHRDRIAYHFESIRASPETIIFRAKMDIEEAIGAELIKSYFGMNVINLDVGLDEDKFDMGDFTETKVGTPSTTNQSNLSLTQDADEGKNSDVEIGNDCTDHGERHPDIDCNEQALRRPFGREMSQLGCINKYPGREIGGVGRGSHVVNNRGTSDPHGVRTGSEEYQTGDRRKVGKGSLSYIPSDFHIALTEKKNGKIRSCVTFRKHYKVTKKGTYTLCHINDILKGLEGNAVLSSF
ncbi:uncharacterized protein VTP21DRAFT_8969 [Calcarisporiella thermophila]|uniref:uncharacterized protein n=1 Tax=Calcarisporiella thermophila TaxID=911321 RepID=UPI0037432259